MGTFPLPGDGRPTAWGRLAVRRIRTGLLLSTLLGAGLACHRTPPPPQAEIGRQVAEAFLEQVRRGQLDAAWQSTTAEFKSYQGRDAFRHQIAQHPWLRQPLEFVQYEVGELNGLLRGQCLYRSAAGKAAGRQVKVAVAQEAGQWKVDSLLIE